MKTKYNIILAVAALLLPLTWANAQTAPYYQFNNLSTNTVGGSPATILGGPGGSVTVSLQVAWPTGATASGGLDYWFTGFGPGGASTTALSITGVDYTSNGGRFSANTTAAATSSADTRSNTTASGTTPDGVPDNQLSPRNGWDLGSTTTDGLGLAAGTYQVANWTFTIAAGAAPGIYTIETFDYSPFGINDTAPTRQAEIFINVAVPEPATLSLFGLGGLGCLGLTLLRARHRVRS